MTFGLDTSVVMRLLTGEPSKLALQTLSVITELLQNGNKCFISNLVVAESYFALQYHYKVPKGKALTALAMLSNEPGIELTDCVNSTLETKNLATAKPGFVDRIIHAEYNELGFSMLTCELAAKSLDDTTVIRS